MFEVEQAMATWRRQMSEAGLAEPVLDELESHLCDDLERRTRSGENVQQAFEAALLTLGEANALGCEFKKLGPARRVHQKAKQAILTLAGIPNQYNANHMTTSSVSNIDLVGRLMPKRPLFCCPLWYFRRFRQYFCFRKSNKSAEMLDSRVQVEKGPSFPYCAMGIRSWNTG